MRVTLSTDVSIVACDGQLEKRALSVLPHLLFLVLETCDTLLLLLAEVAQLVEHLQKTFLDSFYSIFENYVSFDYLAIGVNTDRVAVTGLDVDVSLKQKQ